MSAKMFTTVGKLRQGYHTDQVNAFFDRARDAYEDNGSHESDLTAHHVRIVGFDLVSGGYDVHEVDTALDRLEDALALRERELLIDSVGVDEFKNQLTQRAQILYERLVRPAGKRFHKAEQGKPAYAFDSVDDLCDRLRGYFEGQGTMSVDDVRLSVFEPARGQRGYREGQVDSFLDRVVEVMVMSD